MTIHYVDPSISAVSNGGTSLVVIRTNTDGVANGTTTFTSAGGTFNATDIGQTIFIVGKGPRRITAVGSTTSITLNASVTSGTSLTYNVGGIAHSLVNLVGQAGDEIRYAETPAQQDTGFTATFTRNSSTVTLDQTANVTLIDACDANWTASTNVTCSTSTSRKVGTNSLNVSIASGFTTGKVAYRATGTLDLSARTGITFWLKTSSAVAANVLQIRLCSDTTGTTAVNTINLPAFASTGYWMPYSIDSGGALGSSIQSIAIYAASDPGTVSFQIDNVLACNNPVSATSLHLGMLIRKGNSSDEPLWMIQNVSGTTITLDVRTGYDLQSGAINSKWWGDSPGNGAVYKINPVARIAYSSTDDYIPTTFAGSTSARSNVSGGWDATDFDDQTGETWIDSRGYDALRLSHAYIDCTDGIGFVRPNCGITATSIGHNVEAIGIVGTTTNNVGAIKQEFTTATNISIKFATQVRTGVYIQGGGSPGTSSRITNLFFSNFGAYDEVNSYGVHGSIVGDSAIPSTWAVIDTFITFDNSSDVEFRNIKTIDTGTSFPGPLRGPMRFFDCDLEDAMSPGQAGSYELGYYHHNEARTAGRHSIYYAYGKAQKTSATNWTLYVTSSSATTLVPVQFKIGDIALKGGVAVTVTVKFKIDNAGLSARFAAESRIDSITRQVSGVASSVGSFETMTLNFTPSVDDVIQLFAEAFGGTTHSVEIKELSVT